MPLNGGRGGVEFASKSRIHNTVMGHHYLSLQTLTNGSMVKLRIAFLFLTSSFLKQHCFLEAKNERS